MIPPSSPPLLSSSVPIAARRRLTPPPVLPPHRRLPSSLACARRPHTRVFHCDGELPHRPPHPTLGGPIALGHQTLPSSLACARRSRTRAFHYGGELPRRPPHLHLVGGRPQQRACSGGLALAGVHDLQSISGPRLRPHLSHRPTKHDQRRRAAPLSSDITRDGSARGLHRPAAGALESLVQWEHMGAVMSTWVGPTHVKRSAIGSRQSQRRPLLFAPPRRIKN